ncbi:hypothetical protein ABFS82_14G116800 [Erythranthe guttata]
MKKQHSSKPLNPFAAEYNPIPPGISPDPHAPPPFFFPPPPTTTSPRPPSLEPFPQPPLFLSSQIFTYIPSPEPIYTHYTAYYVNPSPPPPPPPPPPQSPARAYHGQPGRGQRGGFRLGFGSGRENHYSHSSYNRYEKNKKVATKNSDKNSDGFYSKSSLRRNNMQIRQKETRHKVLPLKLDEQKYSTIMIKNIPYSCPRKYLIEFLDEFCAHENAKKKDAEGTSHEETAAYDFLYLPMDFRTKNSRGFAFVNFTTARSASRFSDIFHQKKYWDFVRFDLWPKKIEVARAEIQGKEAAVKHAEESSYECETDEYLPVCFDPPRDGSGQPVQMTVIGNRRGAASSAEYYYWEPRRDNNHH